MSEKTQPDQSVLAAQPDKPKMTFADLGHNPVRVDEYARQHGIDLEKMRQSADPKERETAAAVEKLVKEMMFGEQS